ncbi:exonuclease : Exonuclease OS=delta proteobacterium MLMS-1 GN=MldDRAFT_3354 PE=4 SV=1: RNase_T [Tuwongella immobilis]|uniref:Exonuclease domain-containing protein n=1 Tax=Tuwongella immobilis TaxID=692036 RepID=A0A6C2YMN9_9BACT|nr:exonuclease : Exonuclease OS=delta proteobacterium MLMS-1 GN=MldDRAFT_3354 PE=4 SV=1: RNase_T [Tuwongella immobilis]VTS02668.1 exonuclease : Exonuclease OS=delta proteobacterium MLMS-1 GN=MldDRAFT_3354 PE=4 SV=1: RNase_T [Tuwongella immobilis]
MATKSKLVLPKREESFLAIDFETADYQSDSPCAIGLARVEGNEIVHKESHLIRPPRSRILFTHIHGITWNHVRSCPTFQELWPMISHHFVGIHYLVAHNAGFDRKVLLTSCEIAGITPPSVPFLCTVQISKACWQTKPNDLASVCQRLKIGLNHHDAGSDAEAAARIMIAAIQMKTPSESPQHEPPTLFRELPSS